MKFKSDKYKKARGGYSRMLEIRCIMCDAVLCHYQKDGMGSLKRMYLDRIYDPNVSILRKDFSCSCGHLIGVKMIYAKENRPAFRLFVDAITKKIVKKS